MSQPDLIARLREARPVAPPELRERVRLIAVEATVPPHRRVTWRRAVIVLVPVAAALVAAVVLQPRGAAPPGVGKAAPAGAGLQQAASAGAAIAKAGNGGATFAPVPPAPSSTRLQRYSAWLDLELPTPTAVSAASRQAVAIAASLSGYQQSVVVRTASRTGYAVIVLRIPAANVREAIRRLSALGRITAENVAIQDLQVQVNAADQRIARLQTQLAALQAQFQTADIQRRIGSLTAQIQRLQDARAATVRAAQYATVELQLKTPAAAVPVQHKPGPLHGLGTAFHWAWIGAVYALALGTPLAALFVAIWLLARTVRRRREDRLLAR
jgi:uncharacterized protein DUF4349